MRGGRRGREKGEGEGGGREKGEGEGEGEGRLLKCMSFGIPVREVSHIEEMLELSFL